MKKISGLIVLSTIVILVALYGQSIRAQETKKEFKVGFVNFKVAFRKFNGTLIVEKEIQAVEEKYKEEISAQMQIFKALKAEIDTLQPNSPAHKSKLRQLRVLQQEIEDLKDEAESVILKQLLASTEEIYMTIQEQVATYAKANGYTMVMKVDGMELDDLHSPNLTSLNSKIEARSVLYYDKTMDLTDAIVGLLNE